jgi:isopenicillin-N epimerase
MELDRRGFLAAGGALAAAALAPGSLLAAVERQAARSAAARPATDYTDWGAVKALFPLAPGYTHLSSFYFVSHPRPVREAVEHYRAALDEDPYLFLEHNLFTAESLYLAIFGEIADYVGSAPNEIALMPNTTTGLALVHHGIPLKRGDEVLSTTHDHYSHWESIRYATTRAGASVRRIALYDRGADANRDEIIRRVRTAIRPQTRVLGITWVHSSTGVRLPVADIAQVVRDVNRGRTEANRLLLVVDGVHGFGCSDEQVAKLGVDFFCAGAHKWMFAPRGTGIVYAPAANWKMMQPVIPDFMSMQHFEGWMQGKAAPPVDAAQMSPGGFQAYEHQLGVRDAPQDGPRARRGAGARAERPDSDGSRRHRRRDAPYAARPRARGRDQLLRSEGAEAGGSGRETSRAEDRGEHVALRRQLRATLWRARERRIRDRPGAAGGEGSRAGVTGEVRSLRSE